MADKRCENGHFIDESWDLCPYCPAESAEAEIPVVRPTRFTSSDAASAANPPTRPSGISQARPGTQQPRAVPPPADDAPEVRRQTAVPPPATPRRDTSPVQTPPMERTVAVQKIDGAGATNRYVVGWLVGLNGTARGESYAVRIGRNILGRDKRSDVFVNDDQASSHHADLVFRPDERRFILMDHNSTNGTYVNEVEIEPRRDLAAKDVVRIGSHKFIFMPLCHEGFYWDDEGALK